MRRKGGPRTRFVTLWCVCVCVCGGGGVGGNPQHEKLKASTLRDSCQICSLNMFFCQRLNSVIVHPLSFES